MSSPRVKRDVKFIQRFKDFRGGNSRFWGSGVLGRGSGLQRMAVESRREGGWTFPLPPFPPLAVFACRIEGESAGPSAEGDLMSTIALSRPSFSIPKTPSPGSEGVRGRSDGDYGGGSKGLITWRREGRRGRFGRHARTSGTWWTRWKLDEEACVPIDEVSLVIDHDEGRANILFREAVHHGGLL